MSADLLTTKPSVLKKHFHSLNPVQRMHHRLDEAARCQGFEDFLAFFAFKTLQAGMEGDHSLLKLAVDKYIPSTHVAAVMGMSTGGGTGGNVSLKDSELDALRRERLAIYLAKKGDAAMEEEVIRTVEAEVHESES